MADAVVNVFLERLLNFIVEEGRAVTEFGKLFEDLQRELRLMQGFLNDADRLKRKNHILSESISALRELVYEAEDALADCQLLAQSTSNYNPSCIRPSKIWSKYQIGKRLRDINEKITSIKNSVLPFLKVSPTNAANTNNDQMRRWSSPVYDHTQVVGLEGDKKKVKNWIVKLDHELLVVAFVGMGGLGKTTIAQEVFNDKEVDDWFERRIWVSVSQTFTEEQIMRSILRNLGDASVGDDPGELLRKIRQYLLGKRYLIVMDDVWDKNLTWWNRIYEGLPKDKSSSVIITTRSEDVAFQMNATKECVHRPELLSDDDSWLLFSKVAFAASQGMCSDQELEKVGKEIVKKCGGLPLAIKAVGGMMLCKNPYVHEWKRISRHFRDELAEKDSVMASLQLSYDELPAYLKLCFLSFSIYPEDCVITKEQLVHWWIGAGFVPRRNDRSLTEAGEDCFTGLTNRCLIEVVDKTYNGTITTCKIHDLIRDLVIAIAKDEAFLRKTEASSRHLGITSDIDPGQLMGNQKLRSLVSTTKTGEVNMVESSTARKFTECRYLRVLDISKSIFGTPLSDLLDQIDCLQHLTYLSLSNTHPLNELPFSLEKLHNLEILNFSYCQSLKSLPPYVVFFKKLRVLDVTNCGSLECLPKGVGDLSNLEVLLGFRPASSYSGSRINELRTLKKLRKLGLHVTCSDEIGVEDFDALVELQELQYLSVTFFGSYGSDLVSKLDELHPPRHLHELSLMFYPGTRSPTWLNPSSLQVLRYLSICSGKMATMHEKFWENEGDGWKIEGLLLNSLSDLVLEWRRVQKAMPRLRIVNASWCPELDSFPVQDIGFRGGVWVQQDP